MLDDAIAILEAAEQDIFFAHQQTVDVWEALRTVRAAGVEDAVVVDFWEAAGRHDPHRGACQGSRQSMFACLAAICRQLGRERTWRRHPDILEPGRVLEA